MKLAAIIYYREPHFELTLNLNEHLRSETYFKESFPTPGTTDIPPERFPTDK